MNRLLPFFCFLLILISHPLKAKTGFEIQGLKDISMRWNGADNSLSAVKSFCIRINSSLTPPVPSQLNNVDITYRVQLLGQGSDTFQAVNGGRKLSYSVRLDAGAGLMEMTPGQISADLQGAALCGSPGSNLQLQVITQDGLNEFPSGEYQSTLILVVTNSRLGIRDTQEIDVSITIPRLISINGDDEIDLKTFTGKHAPRGQAGLCVFRNGSGAFKLKAEGVGGGSAFALQNQDLKNVPALNYQINIDSGKDNHKNIEPGRFLPGFKGSASRNCASGNNLSVEAVVPRQWAENAYAGHYQGLLKITVEVE